MCRPSSQPDSRCHLDPRGDAGWALIETLVSAILLVVVALAIAGSLDAATGASAQTKARSVASTLGEQDQERMRNMSPTKLTNYRPAARTVTTDDGAVYSISSRADAVVGSADALVSCTTTNPPDYLRITSTVSGGGLRSPVTVRGLVTPAVGALGAGQGTFTVAVVDRSGVAVPNVPVTATSGSTTYTDVTNDLGCAVFAYVAVGSWTGTANDGIRVDQDGSASASKNANVTEGNVSSVQLSYDRPGSITGTFANPPATATAMRLSNASGWQPPTSRNAPAAAGATSVTASGLYPFLAKTYTAYAGSCDSANPASYSATAPSVTLTPAANASVALALLPIKVTVGGGTGLFTRTLKVKATGSGCTETYTTTVPTASSATTIYMPYGPYTACVSFLNALGVSIGRSAAGTNSGTGWTVTVNDPTTALTC
jgi:type II secretory pathway pseudopilin PulG